MPTKFERLIYKELRPLFELGFTIRRNGHYLVYFPNGRFCVSISSTPGDPHVIHNLYKDLSKAGVYLKKILAGKEVSYMEAHIE